MPYKDPEAKKRNAKEHYQKNKESIKEYQKEYSQKNKESVKKYQKEYRLKNNLKEKFRCECGGKYTHQSKSNHFKTKKHQTHIQQI